MFHRISHSSSESPIESEIEMEPPADQLRRMAFDRRNKNWLEESWNLIDTIEKNNKGRQSVIIKQETLQEVRFEKGLKYVFGMMLSQVQELEKMGPF